MREGRGQQRDAQRDTQLPVGVLVHVPARSLTAGPLIYPRGQTLGEVAEEEFGDGARWGRGERGGGGALDGVARDVGVWWGSLGGVPHTCERR